jgi:hypothetical protein
MQREAVRHAGGGAPRPGRDGHPCGGKPGGIEVEAYARKARPAPIPRWENCRCRGIRMPPKKGEAWMPWDPHAPQEEGGVDAVVSAWPPRRGRRGCRGIRRRPKEGGGVDAVGSVRPPRRGRPGCPVIRHARSKGAPWLPWDVHAPSMRDLLMEGASALQMYRDHLVHHDQRIVGWACKCGETVGGRAQPQRRATAVAGESSA